jgi:TRAP-type C4-dicarboxylate transport system permease small subunit
VRIPKTVRVTVLVLAIGTPLVLAHPALAADANVTQVENFIRSVIKVMAGLAGLVATAYFVVGGYGYITSTGNPQHMEKSKSTLFWAAIGLAITFGAFVLSNIVVGLATGAFGS